MTPDSPTESLRPNLLSGQVSTFALVLLSLLAMGGWVASHWLSAKLARRLSGGPEQLMRARRVWRPRRRRHAGALAAVAVARPPIVLETDWSLALSAFVGALAIEFAMALYAWERRLLDSRIGRLLLGLRVALIGVVLLILAQPVLAWVQGRKIERRVVVLVDDSKSMRLIDRQMTASEKLDLAQFFEVKADSGPASAASVARLGSRRPAHAAPRN